MSAPHPNYALKKIVVVFLYAEHYDKLLPESWLHFILSRNLFAVQHISSITFYDNWWLIMIRWASAMWARNSGKLHSVHDILCSSSSWFIHVQFGRRFHSTDSQRLISLNDSSSPVLATNYEISWIILKSSDHMKGLSLFPMSFNLKMEKWIQASPWIEILNECNARIHRDSFRAKCASTGQLAHILWKLSKFTPKLINDELLKCNFARILLIYWMATVRNAIIAYTSQPRMWSQ